MRARLSGVVRFGFSFFSIPLSQFLRPVDVRGTPGKIFCWGVVVVDFPMFFLFPGSSWFRVSHARFAVGCCGACDVFGLRLPQISSVGRHCASRGFGSWYCGAALSRRAFGGTHHRQSTPCHQVNVGSLVTYSVKSNVGITAENVKKKVTWPSQVCRF